MAWKRGTENNKAGVIRKGQIKEFLRPSSQAINAHGKLKILNIEDIPSLSSFTNSALAFMCTKEKGCPELFYEFIHNDLIYLHAHEHPRSVLLTVLHPEVPPGCIALTATQRLNSKVCTGEFQMWTVYSGDEFVYDAREGVIGDTTVRHTGTFAPSLRSLTLEIRPRVMPMPTSQPPPPPHISYTTGSIPADSDNASASESASASPVMVMIAVDESVQVEVELVCRIRECDPEGTDEDEDDESVSMPDHYRGLIEADTVVFLEADVHINNNINQFHLINSSSNINNSKGSSGSSNILSHTVVEVLTRDGEIFPVRRRLLQPCISLTAIVQAGRGKYKQSQTETQTVKNIGDGDGDGNVRDCISTNEVSVSVSVPVSVDVDACTFDRVLLYLEHHARGEIFRFDPLIATDLLAAAQTLQIAGLMESCERVLGSFQERVRRVPIRFDEILRRNNNGGGGTGSGGSSGKRTDTLLVMSGMVFDITRWLEEHPGGSSIIPEQALNVDSTVFFEIYHASRQSFLYLKEFYIGELAEEDIPLVPLPTNTGSGGGGGGGGVGSGTSSSTSGASRAFLEELRRLTPWRLKREDLINFEIHKSF
eukprot:gene4333-8623_t